MLSKIYKKDSSNASISLTVNDFISFESSNSGSVDIMLLVRGHDMCEAMSVLLHQHDYYDKNTKLNGAKIEKNIRLCYTKEKFKSTQLYASLYNWFKDKNMKECYHVDTSSFSSITTLSDTTNIYESKQQIIKSYPTIYIHRCEQL